MPVLVLGENHGNAKLTEEDVRWIRSCGLSTKEIAKKLNVCATNVRCVLRGNTWSYVI